MEYNSTCKILWSHGCHSAIFMMLIGLYTPSPMTFPFPLSYGGIKEPQRL